jgi:hypothetical protein
MNMNSDETKLAMWLEDELQGEALAVFEASLSDQPERFAEREDVRRWRQQVVSTLPRSEEPPYPDFFNSRISRTIREQSLEAVPVVKRGFSWKSLLMPIAACAGMVLAFQIGVQTHDTPQEVVVEGAPKAIPVEPILYTPERGVNAEWFASADASATVIVLSGVAAIPDSMDFTETAGTDFESEADFTAEVESATGDELGL